MRTKVFLGIFFLILIIVVAGVFAESQADSSRNGITTELIDTYCQQYNYVSGTTFWVYNEKKDKEAHPGLPAAWYMGSTDSSYHTSNQIGSKLTLSYACPFVPPKDGCYECAGFANYLGYLLTGSIPKSGAVDNPSNIYVGKGWQVYTYAQIRDSGGVQPGDVIRVGNHSAIVYHVNNDGSFTVAQCMGSNQNRIWIGNAFNTEEQNTKSLLSSISNARYILRYENNVLPETTVSLGVSDAGYYHVSVGTGELKQAPSMSATTIVEIAVNAATSALTKSNILEVIETFRNITENKLWAKVKTSESKVYYIPSENLEYLFKKVDNAPFHGHIRSGSIGRHLPISGSDSIKSYPFGGEEDFEGKYLDSQENVWYKVKEKEIYLLSPFVYDTTYETPDISFTGSYPGSGANHTGYPEGNLIQGNGFGLRGTVSSNEPLETVTGRIIDRNTNKIAQNNSKFSVTVITSATSYTLTSRVGGRCINDIPFGDLPSGAYRYEIIAKTSSGYEETVHTSNFTVGNASAPTNTAVESINIFFGGYRLNLGEYQMNYYDYSLGNSFSVCAEIYPANATNRNLIWNSSRSDVVSVSTEPYGDSTDAVLTLKGFGTSTITARAQDGSNVSASFTVSVTCRHENSAWMVTQPATTEQEGLEERKCTVCGTTLDSATIPKLVTYVSSIQAVLQDQELYAAMPDDPDWTEDYYSLKRYQKAQIIPTVYPSNATNKTVSYYSDNETIVSVDASGMITANHTGECHIYVNAVDGSGIWKRIPIRVTNYGNYWIGYSRYTEGGDTVYSYRSEVIVPYETFEADNDNIVHLDIETRPNWHTYPYGEVYLIYTKGASLSRIWMYNKYKDPATDPSGMIFSENSPQSEEIEKVVYLNSEINNGQYGIAFERVPGDNRPLTIGIISYDPYFTYIPDTIGCNESISLSFACSPELEYFLFRKDADTDYEFKQVFETEGDLDTIGRVLDVWGNEIAYDDDGGDEKNFKINATLQTNKYYLLGVGTYTAEEYGNTTVKSSPYQPVTEFTCETTLEVYAGNTEVISCAVLPDNATNKTILFEEIDNEICSIDQYGTVYGKSAGVVTTYVYPEDNPSLGREVTITVNVISGTCGDNLTWTLYDGVLTISGTGDMCDFDWDNRPSWLPYASKITNVIISDGVTSIGNDAFYNYGYNDNRYSIVSVDLGNTVKRIGQYAFLLCSQLSSIDFPTSLERIEYASFNTCYALESITIPENVYWIEIESFGRCYNLQSFTVSENNRWFSSYDGVIYGSSMTELAHYPTGKGGHFVMPSTVTVIWPYAFCGCQYLTDITFSNNLEWIMHDAIGECDALTTLELPEGLETIHECAFYNCPNLADIYLPFSVKTYYQSARVFDNCSKLTLHVYPDSESYRYATTYNIPYQLRDMIHATGMSLDLVEMYPGETVKIRPAFTPADTSNRGVICSTVDNEICTVLEDGTVTAKASGVVEVSVQSADNSQISSTAKIYIHEPFLYQAESSVDNEGNIIVTVSGQGNATDLLYSFRLASANAIPFEMKSVELPQYDGDYHTEGFTSDQEQTIGCKAVGSVDTLPAETTVVFKVRPADMDELWSTEQDYAFRFVPYKYGIQKGLIRETMEFNFHIVFPAGSPLTNPDFILPGSTITIEDEAFMGIKAKRVKLPEEVKKIGSMAFANCQNLESIYIPSACTSIAVDAFDQTCNHLKIYCKKGSYAAYYASTWEIDYEIINP